jgi:hypothetical protein
MIEAEFARDSKDFKRIEDEIQIDIINYLDPSSDYRLIVFIYDDSASVEDHEISRKDIMKLPQIVDVVIVSSPSHLKL